MNFEQLYRHLHRIITHSEFSYIHSSNKKLHSAIVKSETFVETKSHGTVPKIRQNKLHRIQNRNHRLHSRPRGVNCVHTFNRARGFLENSPFRTGLSSNNQHVVSNSSEVNSEPQNFRVCVPTKTPVKTESRGTQTDRTGQCKCARAVQTRNKIRRQENKKNKQIVKSLDA